MSKVQKHNRILMILMTIVFMAYVPALLTLVCVTYAYVKLF